MRDPRSGMLRGAAVLALIVIAATPARAAGRTPPGVDAAEFEKAARTLLCDCGCHPQSVYDCSCGRAGEMRDEIAAEVHAGMTGEEVIAAHVAAHGEQALIAPKAAGFNLIAWLGPPLLLLGAGGSVVLVIRRWRGGPSAAAAGGIPQPLDEADRARVEAALREYDE